MIVVADTSPVTALLHLKQLHLLKLLYEQVYLPTAVAAELQTLRPFGYDLSFLQDQKTFIVRSAIGKQIVARAYHELDLGEAEAIALAIELNADLLLIDERIGKNTAEAEGLTCKGVVGVLIEAKHKKLIPAIKPLLDDLIENLKFRLSDRIYRLALERAAEI